MKLASYIGVRDMPIGLGNLAIQLRLRSNVSHTELVFEPGDGVDRFMPDGTCNPDSDGALWCYSAVGLERLPKWSPRRPGRIGGARFKRIVLKPENWELDSLAWFEPMMAAARAAQRQGSLYDWQYIAGFIAWPIPHKESRTACSEEVATVLGIKEPERMDPATLRAVAKTISQCNF